jgi:hypothetical protein
MLLIMLTATDMERITFAFILLFDLLFDKNSSRQGSGEALGSSILSVIVPNLLLSRRFAPFSLCGAVRA